jgi:8-oxo-dGTP pyrophosphatase MutT (NUDIX family)
MAAGGVVFRQEGGWIKVLVCREEESGRWVLPKGHVRQGETLEQAVQREVEEETGVRAHIILPLGASDRYTFITDGVAVFNSVHYFLMRYDSEAVRERRSPLETIVWLPLDSALDLLEYPNSKEILRRCKDALAKL